MYFQRAIESAWRTASAAFPVLLLAGPRQTGKTTVLKHLAEPSRTFVTLDDPSVRLLANEDPALFFQRFPPPVLVDEIQYAPGLLSFVKMRVDVDRSPGAFWLTGSQQFHLMKGISETLAGRVAVVQLLGFSAREAAGLSAALPFLPEPSPSASALETSSQTLFRRIWRGTLPDLVSTPDLDWNLYWSSYVQTYLQRDVRELANVGSQASFFRFLRTAAARSGQLLNVRDLARDVDVSPNTAKAWLSILEASGLVFLLPPWSSNITQRLIKTPKLYFLETGLCSWLAGWTTPEALEAGNQAGAMFETWVLSEVLKSWYNALRKPNLFFYRDRDGREIDFVFEQDGSLYPVEVKASATPRPDWTSSFSALDRFPQERRHGAVVCLALMSQPLGSDAHAVPVGWL